MTKFLHISSQSGLLCASESVLGVRSSPGTHGGGQLSPESRYPALCKAVQGYGRFWRGSVRSIKHGSVVVIAIVAVSYVVSTRIHPLRKCPTCNMTGRHFGGVYKGTTGPAGRAAAAAAATGSARRSSGAGPATPGSSRKSSLRGVSLRRATPPARPFRHSPGWPWPFDRRCLLLRGDDDLADDAALGGLVGRGDLGQRELVHRQAGELARGQGGGDVGAPPAQARSSARRTAGRTSA